MSTFYRGTRRSAHERQKHHHCIITQHPTGHFHLFQMDKNRDFKTNVETVVQKLERWRWMPTSRKFWTFKRKKKLVNHHFPKMFHAKSYSWKFPFFFGGGVTAKLVDAYNVTKIRPSYTATKKKRWRGLIMGIWFLGNVVVWFRPKVCGSSLHQYVEWNHLWAWVFSSHIQTTAYSIASNRMTLQLPLLPNGSLRST